MDNLAAPIIIIIFIAITVVWILIIRLFGAWMLRINIIIRELKEIKEALKSGNEISPESILRKKEPKDLSDEEKAILFDADNK